MPRTARPNPNSNRTDRLSPAPNTTVPGQGYGQAAQQQAAQRAIPMANGPTMQANAAPPGQQAPQAPDVMAMAAQHNGPGAQNFLRPTERPNEPVTHGLPGGPGAGPEALQGIGAAARQGNIEQGTLSQFITSAAAQPNATSAMKDLAARAQGGAL